MRECKRNDIIQSMEFSEVIQGFAERFGIEAPEIVDESAAFDADGMPFFIMRAANEGESEYLVVAADLGEPPPERMEKLYEALLPPTDTSGCSCARRMRRSTSNPQLPR